MKKKFGKAALFLAGALMLMTPAVASAQQSGPFYFTPKIMYVRQNTNDFSADSNYSGGFTIGSSSYSGSDDSNNSFGGGLAVGYDFGATGDIPIRAELEYLYRKPSETSYPNKSLKQIDAYNFINAKHEGEVTAQTVFSNFYWDFRNDSAFTPYIGGGIGAAHLKGSLNSNVFAVSQHSGNSGTWINAHNYNGSNESWNFAWNLGAGAAYSLTDSIALDLSYRYSDLGNVEYGTKYYTITDRKEPPTTLGNYGGKAEADVTTHEVILGLRFSGW